VFDTIETGYDKFTYYVREIGEYETITLGGKRVDVFKKGAFEIAEGEASKDGLKEIWASGTILDGNSSGRFFRDYLTGRYDSDGLGVLYKVYGIGDDQFDYRYFTGPQRAGATKGKYYQGVPNEQLNGAITNELPINSFYDLSANFGNCRHEGGVELRSGKKPEALYQILLNHFSKKKDIVLDFFAGSGTSGAVAHKTDRQYFLIEQLGYIHDLPESRLVNVVNGDQSGISKAVNWQGGGSFIYCEIAEQNQAVATRIQAATNTVALIALWNEIKTSGYYCYKVDYREVDANIQEFAALSLNNQKRFLMEVLDKNLLYVNYCDMTDIDFANALTTDDKAFSRSFYGED
jgi:adenine-specific DNA-methyltransferase